MSLGGCLWLGSKVFVCIVMELVGLLWGKSLEEPVKRSLGRAAVDWIVKSPIHVLLPFVVG